MRVNDIFYSIQGEGFHAGTPARFVRLAGCNLRCPFCDTDHSAGYEIGEEALLERLARLPGSRHVVITGGEPTLQLTPQLLEGLHAAGCYVQVETNGTRALDGRLLRLIDWITVSPKEEFCPGAELRIGRIDELKVVYDGTNDPARYDVAAAAAIHTLQPCDVGDPGRNAAIVARTLDYCLAHPRWRLSLQLHKLLHIP